MNNSMKKNGHYFIKCCIVGLFLLTMGTKTEQDVFYFDSFFPATWYEKGLNATMHAWHDISCMIDIPNKTQDLASFDAVIGRLFFVYYCIGKIGQTKEHVMGEDISYLFSILDRLKSLIIPLSNTSNDSDHTECLLFMIDMMQKSLYPNSIIP